MNTEREISDQNLDEIYDAIVDPTSSSASPALAGARKILDLLNRVASQTEATINAGDLETAKEIAPATPDTLPLPEKIGRFQIREKIGQGGFGMVLLADDPDLRRQVAIKIPRPEVFADHEMRERFLAEGRIVASLTHPGIVPVFESGQLGPVCYIASQFIAGQTLEEYLESSGQLESRQAAAIIAALAEAIGHAHQRGILHRDLKPANILIDQASNLPDLPDRLRITDFGLAKAQFDPQRTQTGSLIGTPAYMSPEQTRNDKSLDPTTDIYSLGAILYRLLTGVPPFLEAGVIDTLNAVRDAQPKPLRSLNADVKKDLEAICIKCLEKNPQRRYADANGLKADLIRFLNRQPVRARKVSPLDRAVRWCQRYPVISVLAGTTMLSLIAGLAVSLSLYVNSNSLYQQSQTQLKTIQQQERITQSLYQTSQEQLVAIEKHKKRSDESLRQAEQTIDKMLKSVSDELKNLPGTKELRKHLLEESLHLQMQMFQTHREDPRVVLRTMTAFNTIATYQSQMNLHDESVATRSKGLKLYDKLSDEIKNSRDALVGKALLLRGVARSKTKTHGKDDEAIAYIGEAITALENSPAKDSATNFNLGQCLQTRGKIYFRRSQWELALDDLEKALEIYQTNQSVSPRSQRVTISQTQRDIAWIQLEQGNSEAAGKTLEQCVTDVKHAIAKSPKDIDLRQLLLQIYNYRVTYFVRIENYDAAIEGYDRMIAAAQEQTENVPDEYVFWSYLLLAESGKIDAKIRAGQSISDTEIAAVTTLGEEITNKFGFSNSHSASLANFCQETTGWLINQQRFKEAESLSDQGIQLRESMSADVNSRPSEQLQIAHQYGIRGRLEFSQDRFETAAEWFEKSLEICKQLNDSNSLSLSKIQPHLCFAIDYLVFCNYRIGKHELALRHANELNEIGIDEATALLKSAEYLGYVIEHLKTKSELSGHELESTLELYLEPARKNYDLAIGLNQDLDTRRSQSPFDSFVNSDD